MKKKSKINRVFLIGTVIAVFALCDIRFASSAFFEGLVICAKKVIPSLFLLMCAASLITESSRLGKSATGQLIVGWFFGLPICALGASNLYSSEVISRERYELLVSTGSLPSIGFYLGVCGNIFGIRRAIILYITSIASAMICVFFLYTKEKKQTSRTQENQNNLSVSVSLSKAIKESGARSIDIAAFCAFFYAFASIITRGIKSDIISAIVFGILEFGGGVSRLSSLSPDIGYIICSGILSFSGISVFMQILSIQKSKKCELCVRKYLLSKIFQASLSMMISAGILFGGILFFMIFALIIAVFLTISYISQMLNKKALNNI